MTVLTTDDKKSFELMFKKWLRELDKDHNALQLVITDNEFSVATSSPEQDRQEDV